MAEPQQTEHDPVADAARAAYAQADGDVARATRLMEDAVRSDRGLRDELTESLLASACYAAVRLQCRIARGRIWRTSRRELDELHVEGARRLVTHAETLLRFPLLGGRHLGEARRAEVLAAAAFYSRQSADMATKARWLTLVADRMPATRRVADVLTEAQLRALQAEARNHA